MNKNTIEVINNVSNQAKPRQQKRVVSHIPIGKGVRQGDIYVINVKTLSKIDLFKKTISVDMSKYTTIAKKENAYQLVPGSTLGSRHFATGNVTLKLNPTNDSSLVGPLIESDTSFTITHPEHAHVQLPSGTYLVCYQLNALTKQRVKD
jgi:hypothetical protein